MSQHQPPPAGWYPNQQGQMQWWDGYSWGPIAPQESPPQAIPDGGATSLVCGILGLVLVSIPIVGLVFAILGVTESSKLIRWPHGTPGRGMAVSGRVLGVVGICLAPLFIYFAFFGFDFLH